ncbi:polymer-forming cytoskeletal protein [Idiomarina loihiensis]|uniref:DUF6701 domain-containing protein n=1 Tax=Idiomarina loihiensis TaxID=135577 RepID=UPI00129C3254|nr:DUF6701 domain-containing protein [Idiomarina loihiensis]MRJ45326.1 Type II secretory pathway component [Idiomarina loihiensis]UTW32287.1 polymer-forming cytoskeletal protein [Idiomarina loihiensis]
MSLLKTLKFVIISVIAFASTPAMATNYNLPNNNLPGCSKSGNTYTCPNGLNLNFRDRIQISGNNSVVINVNGNFNLGSEMRINENGGAQQLTITTTGSYNGGFQSVINANISSQQNITLANENIFSGSLVAANDVSVGFRTNIDGSIRSTSGSVILQGENSITGNVDARDNVIVRFLTEVNGNLNATNGNVVLEGQNDVSGAIFSGGDTILRFRSDVEGAITSNGRVVLEGENTVNGNIIAGDDVTLRYGSDVNGDIDADGSVTLDGANIVDGNINATDRVTIPNSSTVTGYVNAPQIIDESNVQGETCDINNNEGPCGSEPPDQPLDGLGYWAFDQVEWRGQFGEVLDISGNGLHGQALRGANTSGFNPAIAGNPGTCRYGKFNGDNAVRVDNAQSIANAESVSVAFWFKGSATGQNQSDRYQSLLVIGNGPTEGASGRFEVYRQDTRDGGGLYFEIRRNNGEIVNVEAGNTRQGQTNLLDDNWHHLAASYDRNARRLTLYIDGQQADQTSFNGSSNLNAVAPRLYIGGQGIGENSFYGEIDEVFIDDKVLTQSDVTTLKSITRPCNDQRPLCEDVWPVAFEVPNNVPKPFDLPDRSYNTQLPAQLQPIDYLRTGNFGNTGFNYTTNGQTSRVYIDGDVTIQSGRRINVGGNANEMMLIVTGDLTLEQDVQFNGYIYVAGNFLFERSFFFWQTSEVTGGVSVGGRSFATGNFGFFDPEVNYQAPVEPIAGGNFCKASDTAPPVSPVHHYQLSYNSPALTCSAADIEVTACANASCSELYEGSSTVQLNSTAGDWSTNPVSASPVGSTSLEQTNAGTYPLAVETAGTLPLPQNPIRCLVNGNLSESCNIEFSDTGFIFTSGDNFEDTNIPSQVSAVPFSNLQLRAVETNSQTLACQAVTQPLNSVSMSMNCVDPDQCLMGASVNETEVTENNTSNISVSFTDGKAPLEINYKDAGAINLTAQATLPNGKTLRGTSEAFVWRPASIDVEASQDASSNYEGTILAKAGDVFTARLAAINDEGDVTPNFGNEANPETLQLMAQTEAVESYNGEITNADGFTKDGAGIFTNSGLTYTEVGSTRVTAYIGSQNYLPGYHGSPVMLTTESEIGRFIPYEFQMETFGGFSGVCNRNNAGQGDEFYYIGEAQLLGPSFALTAVNKNGETTKNYPTDVVEGELEFYPFNGANGSPEPLNPGQLFATDVELEWGQNEDSAGTATFKLPAPSVTYRRNIAEEGPYEDYKLGIQFNDSEGDNYYSIITESNLPAAAQAPAFKLYDSVKLLYGRFVLDNIFGAEVDDLPLSGRAQFWNGDNFVINTNDNCFTVSVSKLDVLSAIDPTKDPVTSLDTESIELSDTPDSVSLAEGELQEAYSSMEDLLRWQAYGSAAEFTFELTVPSFLQYDWDGDSNYQDNPTAEGTFGIYRGSDRQIYWQEVGW